MTFYSPSHAAIWTAVHRFSVRISPGTGVLSDANDRMKIPTMERATDAMLYFVSKHATHVIIATWLEREYSPQM